MFAIDNTFRCGGCGGGRVESTNRLWLIFVSRRVVPIVDCR